MLRPQRHQPDPFDRRDLPRDEWRETVGSIAPVESAACAQASTASATALGVVYREGPGEVFTGALALPLALGGQWGLRGTPQGYRTASGLVPADVNRAFAPASTRKARRAALRPFAAPR